MFRDKKKLYIFLTALLPMLLVSVLPWIGSAKAEDYTLGDTNQYIYFDLAAGDVLVNGKDFRGSYYEIYADGTWEIKTITGNIDSPEYTGKQFYIYQSNSPASAGVFHINPETPVAPEVPETPENPEDPEAPENPENPETPENPEVPENPEDPETPENPEAPVVPETIELRLPVYAPVTYNGQLWSDYITNNTDVQAVNDAWPIDAAEFQGRTPTSNRIYVVGDGNGTDVTFVFDNLWSDYNTSAAVTDNNSGFPTHYPVAFYPKKGNDLTVLLKGDNRFSDLWAVTGPTTPKTVSATATAKTINACRSDVDGRFIVGDYNPDDSGSITLSCPIDSLRNNVSIFGGNDKKTLVIQNWVVSSGNAGTSSQYGFSNIYINGGVIYVGVPKYKDDIWSNLPGADVRVTHALGSRNLSFITINGGTVTSISNSTAAAIGGGGGYSQAGGIGVVSITGGEVYAYNNSVQGTGVYVPSTAIGSGSCVKTNAATAVVSITGGTVFAQSNGGTAIGGGSSGNATGGTGYITIGGDAYVSALTNPHGDRNSVAIGGGFSGNQSGNKGGNADITITGNPTILSGSIGGGTTRDTSNNGANGYASINISGGDINAQFVMEGGGSQACTFTMSGGTIHNTNVSAGSNVVNGITFYYVHPEGGAVWMKDPIGVSTIRNGSIDSCTALQGGAVYMTGGTFTMSGGSITGCEATGPNGNDGNGGAVYIANTTGASVNFNLSGDGSISYNTAANGGGVCVNGGTITMSGGSMENNIASLGGAVNLSNGTFVMDNGSINASSALQGGAIYMTGGTYTMNNGSITNCTAGNSETPGNGGAVHITSDAGSHVEFTINNGVISGSSATNDGGGIYLENATVNILGGNIANNTATNNGGGISVNEGAITMYGGAVAGNTASNGSGGGLYVSANSNSTLIDFLSGSFSNNTAYNNGGGIAVESTTNQPIDFIMGINVVHPGGAISYDACSSLGPGHAGHTNHISGLTHDACPLVSGNTATHGNGGGFYLNHVVGGGNQTDNDQVNLQIYCLTERGNTASNPDSNGMFMQGGIVEIFGDEGYNGEGDPACNVYVGSTILVEGGQVSVYGTMDNPHFDAPITVNIINPDEDFFHDFRYNNVDNHKYFSVSYFENFEDGGNYTQYQYEMRAGEPDFTIEQNIYVHEGYQLLGWDTEPDGTGIRFEVGADYEYRDNPDSTKPSPWRQDSATGDRYTLTLYAIWQEIAYFIDYNSNPPAGVPCYGEMADQRVTILGTNYLRELNYSIPNYRFTGWTLDRNGSGTHYSNHALISTPFTQENGATITLYAQWELCPHDHCVLTANDNVITQTCSDCGHIATARITADSVDYDGREHPARVIYSDEWAGEQNLVITYALAPNSDWDDRDDIDNTFTPSTIPVHAGSYTASVVIDSENSISCNYEIRRIKWPSEPSSPEINLDSDYSVTVNSTSAEGAIIEYCMAEGNSDHSAWSTNNNFDSLQTGHYYIFYARNAADRDHIESDSSRSQVYLYDGNNTIVFHPETGLMVTPAENVIDFTVSLEEGYHYYNYEISTDVDGEQRADVYCTPGTLIDLVHSHRIIIPSGINNSTIDVYITGAVKDCTVDSYITEDEVFTSFTNTSATISSDSAFTARFVVSDYRSVDYKNQRFVFGNLLPAGTTLILRESDDSYWYYNVAASTSEILVNDFDRMGGNVIGGRTVASITTEKNFSYQLIVDFSDVAEANRISGSLSVTLTMTPNDSEVPDLEGTTVYANLVDVATFTIAPGTSTIEGNSLTASCTYLPSSGTASIWNRRNTSLVLTAADNTSVPSDLSLTIYDGQATRNIQMNENRQFIIPLGEVGSYNNLRITLNSEVFTSDSMVFDAIWYVSASRSGQAPVNGYAAASAEWTFTNLNAAVPSLRIDDVNNPAHIYSGSSVPVDIRYLNIPAGYRIQYQLYNQQTGAFTGWGDNITDFADGHTQITVPVTSEGSYYIRAMIQRNSTSGYVNALSEPVLYYFIVR